MIRWTPAAIRAGIRAECNGLYGGEPCQWPECAYPWCRYAAKSFTAGLRAAAKVQFANAGASTSARQPGAGKRTRSYSGAPGPAKTKRSAKR